MPGVKRRKGQHRRTWKRQMLLMQKPTQQQQPTTQPLQQPLPQQCVQDQVAALQWQIAQRDVELLLLRDTLSLLLAKEFK